MIKGKTEYVVAFKEGPLLVCCCCAEESGPLYLHIHRTEAVPMGGTCSRCNGLFGRKEAEEAALRIVRGLKDGS